MLLCSDCSVCARAWLPSILTGNEFAKKLCTRASSSRRCIHGWMGKGCVSRGVYARMWCFRLQCNMPPVSRKVQAYKALLGWRATVVMAVGMGGELRAAGWEEYRTLAFARLCIGPCCYLPPAVVAARARRPTRQRAAGHALGLRDLCRTRKRYPFSQRSPGLAASMCSSTLLDRSPTRVPTHVDAYLPTRAHMAVLAGQACCISVVANGSGWWRQWRRTAGSLRGERAAVVRGIPLPLLAPGDATLSAAAPAIAQPGSPCHGRRRQWQSQMREKPEGE